jgi:hypothetical protein
MNLTGLAGILSIALGALGVAVDQMWTFPAAGATAAQITSFAAAHRPALFIAMVMTASGVGLWLVFGAGVWLWLREAIERESILCVCFLVGVISFVTLLLAGFSCFFVLIYRAPHSPDPRLLYDMSFGLLAVSGIPTALALGSYATLAFGSGRLPTSTAWTALIAALAHLVLLASLMIKSGFFSLQGPVTIAIPGTLFAWILTMSVVLLRFGAGRDPEGTSSEPCRSGDLIDVPPADAR